MSIAKYIITAAVAASLFAGSMLPLATAANADSWGGRGGYDTRDYRRGPGPGNWNHAPDQRAWNTSPDRRFRGFQQYSHPQPDHRNYRVEHRERHDRGVARGVAIGIGVLMLGAILSQAGSHYDRYDY